MYGRKMGSINSSKKQLFICSISVGHFHAKRTNESIFINIFIDNTKKMCLKKGGDILRIYKWEHF
jgi:hypothetical protein